MGVPQSALDEHTLSQKLNGATASPRELSRLLVHQLGAYVEHSTDGPTVPLALSWPDGSDASPAESSLPSVVAFFRKWNYEQPRKARFSWHPRPEDPPGLVQLVHPDGREAVLRVLPSEGARGPLLTISLSGTPPRPGNPGTAYSSLWDE